MYRFGAEQKVYEIAGVRVGGRPGENPTVMIGSIFYKRDGLIRDERTGEFDRIGADCLMEDVEDVSRRTGLPFMLDVVCSTPEAVESYLGWAADATDAPLLLDAVSDAAAIKGLEYIREQGLLDRTVFNSINLATPRPIYEKIDEVGLETAIVLTYSTEAATSSRERVGLLETLLPRAEAAGITRPLIDTFVMDVPTLGLACRALMEVKDRYGYPAGCGAHNAAGSWKELKRVEDQRIGVSCSAIVDGLPVALGADYVIYGPLNQAGHLFPAISVIDTSLGQVLMEDGVTLTPDHPRFLLARSLGKRGEGPSQPPFRGDGLDGLRAAVRNYDVEAAVEASKRALDAGIDPLTVIEEGITPQLREIGVSYGRGNIWFIDLMSSALAAEEALRVLEPEIKGRGPRRASKGRYLIGTVTGDIHDIGKNIAGLLLMANGFEVIDLGVDVSTDKFVEAVREYEPDILGMSALLTSTIDEQRKVIESLSEEGLRDRVKVIIGGAATSREWAEKIGADAFAENAVDGVNKALKLLEG